jgi:membrane associated rhomboid family serine protease
VLILDVFIERDKMIPLKDRNPTKRFPIMTVLLIAANIAVFIYQLSLGSQLEDFYYRFSMIPHHIFQSAHSEIFRPLTFLTIITSMFLHGGWLHVGGNMLYLWIFGDNVEDKLGHGRFFFFYLICGIAASVLHIFIEPASTVPTLGASGAISGVLGAYILMFPRAKILTLIPIFIFIQLAELPAFIILGFWFVLQFFNGILSLKYASGGMAGIAWWAHIGGFIAGLLLVIPFRKYR